METLNYSEQSGSFQSVIDVAPTHYMEFGDSLYFIDPSGRMTLMTPKAVPGYMPFHLKFAVNADYQQTKVFDNVEIYSGTEDNVEIDSALFKNSYQISEEVIEVDKRENTYKFAIPRANLDKLSRMRDKYLMCSYDISGKYGEPFSIPYIKTKYRHSVI